MTPVNCSEAFNGIKAVIGATATVFGGTLTLAEPTTEGVLTELAATVTVKVAGGGLAGAVYVTATPLAEVDGETVPQSVASHCTTHVTPLFVGSLLTVAANRTAVAANTSTGPGGSMAMVTAETVTVEEAVAAALLTEVAVSVTPKLEARGAGGAAYVVGLPLAVAAGDTVPQGAAEQDTVHATPRLAVSLLTVAATCTLAPGSRVPKSGPGRLIVMGTCEPPLPLSPPQAPSAAAPSIGKPKAVIR